MKFLLGLNDSFSQARTQVLLMDPLPSISKVFALLIQEEIQRSVTNQSSVKVDLTTLVARMQNFNTNLGTSFGGNGNGAKGKDKPVCTHSGKMSHTIDKCYRLYDFPPNFKFKNKTSIAHQVSATQPQELLPCTSSNNLTFPPKQC